MASDANFFPFTKRLGWGRRSLNEYHVGDLIVPIVASARESIEGMGIGTDGDPDETGNVLWACSTLVSSLLLRCRSLIGATDVLELGCGSGFCGLVAKQLARSVVFSDREPKMRQLTRDNLELQQETHSTPSKVEPYGWAEGDAWPAERFGLVLASDVLYGPHASLRTCPEELARFVALLERSLARVRCEGRQPGALIRASEREP